MVRIANMRATKVVARTYTEYAEQLDMFDVELYTREGELSLEIEAADKRLRARVTESLGDEDTE